MASFFSRLKNIALGAYHQVSPFDNGQTYSTYVNQTGPSAPQPARPVQVQAPPPAAPPPRVQNIFTPNLKPANQIRLSPIKTPKISVSRPPGHPSLASRLLHNITHNPVTNAVGSTVVKPIIQADKAGIQLATHNPVSNAVGTAVVKPVVNAGVGLAQSVGHIASIPYDIGRTIPASLTNNKIAMQHATTAADKNIGELSSWLRFAPRAAGQVALSLDLRGHPTENTRTATSPVGKFLFGKEPVASLQKTYKDVKETQGTQAAVGNTALTALMDALALKGGKDTVHSLVKKTPAVIAKAGEVAAATPLNQAGGIGLSDAATRHPAVQALNDHLTNLNAVRNNLMANNGSKTALHQNDLAYKATLQAKNDTIKQVTQGGYIKVGYPNADKLPQEAQDSIKSFNNSTNSTPEQRIKSNKLTPRDIGRAMGQDETKPFSQSDVKTLAKSIPEFKDKPIMTFNPKGQINGRVPGRNTYEPTVVNTPTLEYKTANHHIKINANHFFPKGTDLTKLKKGEQVDMSAALGGGANKIPAVIESKPGVKLSGIETKPVVAKVKQPPIPATQTEHAKALDNLEANTGTGTPQYEKLMNAYIDKYGNKPVKEHLAPEANLFLNDQLKQAGVDPNNMHPADAAEVRRIIQESHKVAPDQTTTAEHIGQVIHRMANNEPLAIKPPAKVELKGGTPPPTGDIKTIAAIDELQRAGKPIPPELARKAGIAVAGDRAVKPAGAKISDAEWESLVKSGQNLEPDTIDHVMANSGGDVNVIAAEKAKKAMYQMADQRAFDFLDKGGNRNTALDLYKRETGASDKMAAYRINNVLSELHARKSPPGLNPLIDKVSIPEVNPGDYQKARGNVQLATSHINVAGQLTMRAIKRLSRKEKKQFADLVEHPEAMTAKTSGRMRDAVNMYRELANRVHATSEALGGRTAFLKNYYNHLVDLGDKAQREKYMAMAAKKSPQKSPSDFAGLNRMPRVFPDIRALHEAGFKLKHEGNPAKQTAEYINSALSQLRKQALVKGFTEADIHEPKKLRNFDLRNGSTIPLSDKGMAEIKNFDRAPASNIVAKGYRGLNRFLKRTLLSISQFHTININALQATPSLIGTPKDWVMGESHPILAAKGLVGSARALFDVKYADKVISQALKDGTIDYAARVGTPISYGSDFSAGGLLQAGKSGLGEKAVFERQLPVEHIAMVRGLKADLERRKISPDSPEARKAGLAVHKTMGYINQELANFDPRGQRGLSDILLAPQFTRTKWELIRDAIIKGGKEGNIARRAVIGKYTAEAGLIIGLSYAFHQKSDDIRDMLLRALVHPSIPTPIKDKKGNTMEIGLPQNFVSEAASLGISLKRDKNGRLGLDFSPSNIPGNLESYGRSRLAVLPATGLKLRTNTNYGGKNLFDPNAPFGVKAEQAATTLTGDLLPISTQGVLQTNAVKSKLPGNVQDILNANSPGTDPVVKSIASSFGATIRSDKTVGKAKDTTAYFNALDEARKGLNHRELDALDVYTGGKKNSVTGKYEVKPTLDDQRAKATALLSNPKVIDNLIAMNKKLQEQGQKVDPLWVQGGLKPGEIGYIDPKQQIIKYLQYQAMPPHGPDQKDWHNKNDVWYKPLADQRTAFFNSLPQGDPNKPKAPLEYPEATGQLKTRLDRFFSLQDSKERAQYVKDYPEVQKQLDAQDEYYNKLRSAQGYARQKGYPKASPQLQGFIDMYLGADKTTRKGLRLTQGDNYRAMAAYFDQTSIHGINQQGGLSNLEGEPDYTGKELKQISGVAKDIYQMPDGSFQLVPAGWTLGLQNGSSFGGFPYHKRGRKVKTPKPGFRHLKLKKTSIKASSTSANAGFNRSVSQIGIKPGGGNKIRIAA